MMSHIHLHHSAAESFWISGALIFAAFLYLRGWLGVRSQDHGSVEGWRVGSFLLGLLFIWIAMASPLSTLDHEMLTAHMVQHLLLMTFAPPLILLGLPRNPLKHSPQAVGSAIRSAPMQQLVSALTHPAFCWFVSAGALIVWHIPAVFMLGMRSQVWHGVEQVCFLATGLLFWWPVIRPSPNNLKWPESSILLYLFFATLPCDILSGFLVFCDRVVYPVFLMSPRSFGLSTLEDQQCAGALMWTCVTVVYLIAGAIVAARLLSPRWLQDEAVVESQSLAVPRQGEQSMEAF